MNNSGSQKSKMHPRNKMNGRYDFKALISVCPELSDFVKINEYNVETIDFHHPEAVKTINKALLIHHYKIKKWSIPAGFLCPAIPGRADYIHNAADLLNNIPTFKDKKDINCLDIGTGANLIYPIIGHKEYKWHFVGSDIDPKSLESGSKILENNPELIPFIEIREQTDKKHFFKNIIKPDEKFELTICNPPFHSSFDEAQKGTKRKLQNLKKTRKKVKAILNFGGQNTELWYEGGETRFITNMVAESKEFSTQCLWFTTLVSKEDNVKRMFAAIKTVKARDVKVIEMGQGNKKSRIVAWSFYTKSEQANWKK